MPRNTTKAAESKATKTNGNGGNSSNSGTAKIHDTVVKSGGIAKVTLGDIRDELGYARLGKTVLSEMNAHLAESGLGFFPGWVLSADNPEPRQWQEIWLYQRDGSAKSVVLDAVSDPDNNDLVAALNVFSQDTPDYSKMKNDQKVALIKAIVS